MRRAAGAAAALGWAALAVSTVRADGGLPPQPYHYLHPPAALAGSNSPPQAGQFTFSAQSGRSTAGFGFTSDGQAGLSDSTGSFRVSPSATSVQVRIQPVETAPGLPAQVAADGNAYQIVALGEPGNLPARLIRRVSIILKWPHLPVAMYQYRSGTWRRVCFSDQAITSPSTFSCRASTLGIFVLVGTPSAVGGQVPTTPVSSTRFAWINRYLALIAAAGVVVLAAVAGYFVSRPDKEPGSKEPGP